MESKINYFTAQKIRMFKTHPYFFLLVTISLSFNLISQNIDNYYSSYPQENGRLYFITSKIKIQGQSKDDLFQYDLTHNTATDSFIINFTLLSKSIIDIDSLIITNLHNDSLSFKCEKFFIENFKKNYWKHRYTAKIPYLQFTKFYNEKQFQFIIKDKKNNEISFLPKGKKSIKEKEVLIKVFKMIDINK